MYVYVHYARVSPSTPINTQEKKRKYEPPIPMRVGRKKRNRGPDTANKLPQGQHTVDVHVHVHTCAMYIYILCFGWVLINLVVNLI